MRIKKISQICAALYERRTRNPFALHAKQRKSGKEASKKGRGSYHRRSKHKVDFWV